MDTIVLALSFFIFIFIIIVIFAIIEELRRCRHLWETVDTQKWRGLTTGGEYLKFIQKCKKCGEINIVEG